MVETAQERALDLLAENRVALLAGHEDRLALVVGRSGWYRVSRGPRRITCTCPAVSGCSHSWAAGILWQERDAARVEAAA